MNRIDKALCTTGIILAVEIKFITGMFLFYSWMVLMGYW